MGLSFSAEPSKTEGALRAIEKEDIISVLILCSLCLALFFFQLGNMPLWDVDEGMHAATSKDMVLTGDWITPKINGENFYDKTPLFNWLVALSFTALGFTELAARLPAALLGIATVLVTFALGRRLAGPGIGLLAGAILATSPEFIVLSRSVVHDISLAFFITAALFFFYQAFTLERRRRPKLMLFYAASGFAVLAKGPIGILLPGMIIFLFLFLRGRLDFIKQMSPGPGALLFFAIAAPWYVLVSMKNSDFASYFFLKQNFGNFLSKAQAKHLRPFYYYVPVLLAGMLPWSFIAPLAVSRPFAKGFKKINGPTLFLVCWFAVIFLFFSAASSKLGTYMLPAFPALALLIALLWDEATKAATAGARKGIAWCLAPAPLIFLAGSLYVFLNPRMSKVAYGMDLHEIGLHLIMIALVMIIALALFFFRKYALAFWAFAAAFIVGFLFFISSDVQRINPYRSTRTLAREMDGLLPADEPLVFFGRLRDSALFYTNRRAQVLNTKEQLIQYLGSDKKTLCIIERSQYENFPEAVAASTIIDEEGNKLLIAGKERR